MTHVIIVILVVLGQASAVNPVVLLLNCTSPAKPYGVASRRIPTPHQPTGRATQILGIPPRTSRGSCTPGTCCGSSCAGYHTPPVYLPSLPPSVRCERISSTTSSSPQVLKSNINLFALQHEILYLLHKAAFLSLWCFATTVNKCVPR